MKVIILLLLAASLVHAQQTDTVINVNKAQIENTTKYEIVDGTDEISGDTAPLKKTAQDNWKKACAAWTKDFKAENKDRIISVSCGKMTCSKEGVESTCVSSAKYKIRVLASQTGGK